ncbi:hypothetical protein ACFLUJ_05830 [Chloroflexota bacterium]
MLRQIASELKEHAPFTVLGAAGSIIIMLIIVLCKALPQVSQISYSIFYILHPTHVVLSALVTTALYKKYSSGKPWAAVLIGYLGSVGIATISDSIIPYLGETLMVLPYKEIHLGFIEEWWLVNSAALLGITISFWKPITKFPHSGHVMISTWASLFHIIMALGETVNWVLYLLIFLFLFLAVWLPCCISDIVFPLLLVRKRLRLQHR